MVQISLFLFGKPSWEMEVENGRATPEMLRAKAVELKSRLERAAEIFEKLISNGWDLEELYGAVYSLEFYKRISKEEARTELLELGIGLDEVGIVELEHDEYDEEMW